MIHLPDKRSSLLYEATSNLDKAVGKMDNWDADLETEAEYEEAYALYQHWLGRVCELNSGVLLDTYEQARVK